MNKKLDTLAEVIKHGELYMTPTSPLSRTSRRPGTFDNVCMQVVGELRHFT